MSRNQWQQLCSLLALAADEIEASHGPNSESAETLVSALDVAQEFRNAVRA
jgi:hypothetical protein